MDDKDIGVYDNGNNNNDHDNNDDHDNHDEKRKSMTKV